MCKRIISCVILNLLFTQNAFANNDSPHYQYIEKLIQQTIPTANVGILVQDPTTGVVVYERRSQEYFAPASTTKVFTAAAGLLSLGADYTYKTSILINQKQLHNNKLLGNLYIQFTGDPTLTSNDLQQLITQVKSKGINEIQGNIVLDTSRFQDPTVAQGWSADSLSWYYAAPISSVILNENVVKLTVNSNKPVGQKATVSLALNEPITIALATNLSIVSTAQAQSECVIDIKSSANNHMNIAGCWPAEKLPRTLKVAISDPDFAAKQLVAQFLKSQNIAFSGKIIIGQVPKTEQEVIAQHTSEPLNELLNPILADSNNLYADSLLKTLGYTSYNTGTFQIGLKALMATLAKQGKNDLADLKLFDGSGLSRYNLVTPSQLVSLLALVYNDPKIASHFKQALPIAGETGTLANRMQSAELKGKLRAKTGSLQGVTTLAGYLKKPDNKDLIIVVMVDNIAQNPEKVREFQEALCHLFVNDPNNLRTAAS